MRGRARRVSAGEAARNSQAEFERLQRQKYIARVVKVGRDNPSLSLAALAERFGDSEGSISKILSEHKVKRENDDLTQQERQRLGAGTWSSRRAG